MNSFFEVIVFYGMLVQVIQLLVELGYYVILVLLVSEIFKQNGLVNVVDIYEVLVKKLCEIFGVDVGFYINIIDYGIFYKVVQSDMVVLVEVKLVDLCFGKILWQGLVSVFSVEGCQNQNNGLLGVLFLVVVNQIISIIIDVSYKMVVVISNCLLCVGGNNGLLYGLCLL